MKPLFQNFRANKRASVGMFFAITSTPLMLVGGAAIDYSRALGTAEQLQQALDTATLSGAILALRNREDTSIGVFNAALPHAKIGATATSAFRTEDNPKLGSYYYGEASVTIPTMVVKVLGIRSITIKRKSAAVFGTGDNSCILTRGGELDLEDETVTLNGATNVNLSGCTIRSNHSIKCNGRETGSFKAIAAGEATNCANSTSGAGTVPDIYSGVAANIENKCGDTNETVQWNNENVPLGPNVISVPKSGYNEIHICGTLNITGSGTLAGTSATGDTVIVVENGNINVASDANIAALRTTFVLSGQEKKGELKFPQGNGHSAQLAVSASVGTGNPWAGLAIYQDPRSSELVESTWRSGATLIVDGVNYLPRTEITLSGTAATGSSECSKLVSYSFRINGAVSLEQTASKCTDQKVAQFNVHPYLVK